MNPTFPLYLSLDFTKLSLLVMYIIPFSTKEGFISIGIFAASAIIFGVIMFPPKGQSRLDKFFFKTLFNSMVNRLANYERDKDVNRAAAMRMLVNKFKTKYSKKII